MFQAEKKRAKGQVSQGQTGDGLTCPFYQKMITFLRSPFSTCVFSHWPELCHLPYLSARGPMKFNFYLGKIEFFQRKEDLERILDSRMTCHKGHQTMMKENIENIVKGLLLFKKNLEMVTGSV